MAAAGRGGAPRAVAPTVEQLLGRQARAQALSAALLECTTTEATAEAILNEGVAAFGAAAGSVCLVDVREEGGRTIREMRLAGAVGYPADLLDAWRRWPLAAPVPLSDAVRSGRAVYLPSRDAFRRRYPSAGAAALSVHHAWTALPLLVKGQAIGALGLSYAAPQGFPADERLCLEGLALQGALAIERAGLFRAAEERRSEADAEERRTEGVLESIGEMFYSLDGAWRFTYLNRRTESYWGIPREALLGKCLWDVSPEAHGSRVEHEFRRAVREQVTVEFEVETGTPHGWFEVRACPSAQGLSVYYRNVTERKRAEIEREVLLAQQQRLLGEQARLVAALRAAGEKQNASLIASEERFRLLVEGVTDYAIFLLNPAGNVVTWNAGAERFNGYAAEEILGKHFSVFYPEEDLAAGKPARELEVAAREGRYAEEGWRVKKDGSRFWASVVITALKDEAGALRGFGKVTHDATERRERERAQLAAEAAEQQRRFLKDVLASVTERRLSLCDGASELPDLIAAEPLGPPLPLTRATLKELRARVQAVAAACGLPRERMHDLLTGAGEASMNAVTHGGGGTATVFGDGEAGKVQVWIEDTGGGIDLGLLPRATLERGFSSAGTLGQGFWLMLQTCDRLYLLTGPQGTTVVLEQGRTPPRPDWMRQAA